MPGGFYNSLNYVALFTVATSSVFALNNRYSRVKGDFGLYDCIGFFASMATLSVTLMLLVPLSIRFQRLEALEIIELIGPKFAFYLASTISAWFMVSVLHLRGVGDAFRVTLSWGERIAWVLYGLLGQTVLVASVLILNLMGDPENHEGPVVSDHYIWLFFGFNVVIYPILHSLGMAAISWYSPAIFSRSERNTRGHLVEKTVIWIVVLGIALLVPVILQTTTRRSVNASGYGGATPGGFEARWKANTGHCRLIASPFDFTATECSVFTGTILDRYGCPGGQKCGWTSAYGFIRWPIWMSMIFGAVPLVIVIALFLAQRYGNADSFLNRTRARMMSRENKRERDAAKGF